ncbi:transglutaminase domain-containing protein [Candidatus Woesearchaeota archaeon]|nr:transglutaminase domain-containing protein [Candidatus Woesearchaeota archaeon]
MQNLSLDSFVTKDWLKQQFALESKEQFYKRVYQDFDNLNLNKKPFDATQDIIENTWELVCSHPVGGIGRAHAIYGWMIQNFYYDNNISYYYSASETFYSKNGRCCDFSFLYTTMSRIAGVDSNFVWVDDDNNGKKCNHGCSSIKIDNNLILVDVAYKEFDIRHRRFEIYNDSKTIEHYNQHSFINNASNWSYKKNHRNRSSILSPAFLSGLTTLLIYLGTTFGSSVKYELSRYKDELSSFINYEEESEIERNVQLEVEKRFQIMLGFLVKEFPNNILIRNAKYPDDYYLVSDTYTKYIDEHSSE